MRKTVIMTSQDITRSLSRIAHEIIERNKTTENLILIGMHTRGVPLAARLVKIINSLGNGSIPTGVLDISAYRDDRTESDTGITSIPSDIDGKSVVLVDDVLYTGRSIRAAMDALIDRGRPDSIQLAVLVDRGHRELPIRADYVGKNIPSARHEEILVRLQETDGVDEVLIIKSGQDDGVREAAGEKLVRKER